MPIFFVEKMREAFALPIFFVGKSEKLLQCKSFSHFFNKNISVFGYKVVTHLTSCSLNELVKLTML